MFFCLLCGLLSIYYLWHTENNGYAKRLLYILLWFAFNLLSLTYWKQRINILLLPLISCDLLSIYYLWHTENNGGWCLLIRCVVVICFQSIIFDILKTTQFAGRFNIVLLWFAFNLLSLTYWKQQGERYTLWYPVVICFQSIIFDILKTTGLLRWKIVAGCDLLSIYYLWHTENNQKASDYIGKTVVICFQSIIFDILKTTDGLWAKRKW